MNNSLKPIIIPTPAQQIITRLKSYNYEAVIVGGCVRDSLLNKTPHDYDIATSATPQQVLSIFKDHTVIPTGIQHGTVTIIISKTPYEVTTYRIDGNYTDGRRPEQVTFTPTLYEDLRRRDFTVNALAYSKETALIDYFNGTDDLKNKIIRCVGNPTERFSEDYLRMLRAYRFAAVLGFSIDTSVLDAIKILKTKITAISAERIRMELDKLLLTNNFSIITQFLEEFSPIILPEIIINTTILQNTAPHIPQRLASLFHYAHNAPQTVITALKRLKYDNNTITLTHSILTSSKLPFTPNKSAMKRLLRDYGETTAKHNITYHSASRSAENAAICSQIVEEILLNNEPYTINHLQINGSDLISAGIPQGKAIGKALNFLLEQVIENPNLNTKEQLINLLAVNKLW